MSPASRGCGSKRENTLLGHPIPASPLHAGADRNLPRGKNQHQSPVTRFTRCGSKRVSAGMVWDIGGSPASRGCGSKLSGDPDELSKLLSPASRGCGSKLSVSSAPATRDGHPLHAGADRNRQSRRCAALWPRHRFTRCGSKHEERATETLGLVSPASRGCGSKLANDQGSGARQPSPASRGCGSKRVDRRHAEPCLGHRFTRVRIETPLTAARLASIMSPASRGCGSKHEDGDGRGFDRAVTRFTRVRIETSAPFHAW